jgi:HD-GYP domain-containing protein (c-di-GMP phosphodiesterase class II)
MCGNDNVVQEIIMMHHERADGYGYPRGIMSNEINIYAKIIGLVDTYESLTNKRPYRERMSAHKAVRFIIGSLKDYFDADVMKVFIDKMSVYPIGSIVRLDTQELARVISVQPGSPLRPVVMLIWDAFGGPAKERTIIDLSKQGFPFILESV